MFLLMFDAEYDGWLFCLMHCVYYLHKFLQACCNPSSLDGGHHASRDSG